VAQDGELNSRLSDYAYPDEAKRSIKLRKVSPEVFQIDANAQMTKIRVVEIINETITRETVYQMKAIDGKLLPAPEEDILKGAVFNKSQGDATPSLCFIKGVGLRKGAIATSLIWDTNNVLVIGTSDEEMAIALNRLVVLGGGVVVVKEKEAVAQLPLPICGIISQDPLPEIIRHIKNVESACLRSGTHLTRPLLTLQTLPFTGLPYLRPTDKGLADIRKGELVPLTI
jgi:adenine deaminase